MISKEKIIAELIQRTFYNDVDIGFKSKQLATIIISMFEEENK